jgi:hypothetical protein
MSNEGQIVPDDSDEVIAGSAVVYQGEVRNAMARENLGLTPLPEKGE